MKKSMYSWLLGLLFVMVGQTVWAQKVSGVVTGEEDGLPIPGVSVVVKGTTKGAVTDIDGKFDIAAKEGEIITFSLVGYQAQDLPVGKETTINLILKGGNTQLGEVVVTALGLTQSQRSLTTNNQTVKGEEIAETQRDNFMEALQGRVAGLMMVSTSGASGSSALIQLRGASSIGGSNSPLIVVDGLPIDNSTFSQSALVSDQPNRSNDYQNRAADINPNDIASVTVLKGPEAAALYGSQGSSGAIIITTKKGSKGRGKISYDNSFSQDEVYRVPKTQTTYMRGFNGVFDPNELRFFGPKLTAGLPVFNNYDQFFQTGSRQAHNLSFETGSDRLSYRLSTNYTNREDVVPNTGMKLFNVRLSGTTKLLDNLELNTSISFTNTNLRKSPVGATGYLVNLFNWPFYEDMTNYLNPDGTRRRLQTTTTEYDNPYFISNKLINTDLTNRTLTNLGATWTPASWLTVVGRFGVDAYSTRGNYFAHPEANGYIGIKGSIENYTLNSRLLNGNLLATAKKTIKDFSAAITVGTDIFDKDAEVTSVRGEKLYDPNYNSINNVDPLTMRNKLTIRRNRLLGAFAKADFSWKDLVYLQVTGRNDWSSTLPVENRSYFYPSVSGSVILNELMGIKNNDYVSLIKLRAAYAVSGKDADPYRIEAALAPQTTTGGGFAYNFYGGNPGLKPEFVTGRELGAEMKFLKSRVSLDVTYFKNERSEQIVSQRLSYGTGFVFGLINGGSFEVSGWEAQLGLTPVKEKDFKWEVLVNFTKNATKVLSLPAAQPEYYNSDTWLYNNARASAFIGYEDLQKLYAKTPFPYISGNQVGAGTATAIGGYSYARNKNGDVLISPSTGLPVINTNFLPIGDRNPDFMVGIVNTFNYKGLGFNFNLDVRKGGDVFNGNEMFLFRQGLSARGLDRTVPYTFNGVLRDGAENSEKPTTNTIQVTPQTRSDFYSGFSEEDFVEHDINWLRIRDVTLSYTFPDKWFQSMRSLKNVRVYVTGTELYMWTNYTGGDPSVNGTTATSAGVGAWGFDFGKIGRPRSVSAGIRFSLQ